jgi:hypothetical protein
MKHVLIGALVLISAAAGAAPSLVGKWHSPTAPKSIVFGAHGDYKQTIMVANSTWIMTGTYAVHGSSIHIEVKKTLNVTKSGAQKARAGFKFDIGLTWKDAKHIYLKTTAGKGEMYALVGR